MKVVAPCLTMFCCTHIDSNMSSQSDILSQMKLKAIVSAAHELSAGIGSLVRVAEPKQVFERLIHALTLISPDLKGLISSAKAIYFSDDNQFREQRYCKLLMELRAIISEVIVVTDSIIELSAGSNATDVLRAAKTLARRARELDLEFAQRSVNHL